MDNCLSKQKYAKTPRNATMTCQNRKDLDCLLKIETPPIDFAHLGDSSRIEPDQPDQTRSNQIEPYQAESNSFISKAKLFVNDVSVVLLGRLVTLFVVLVRRRLMCDCADISLLCNRPCSS